MVTPLELWGARAQVCGGKLWIIEYDECRGYASSLDRFAADLPAEVYCFFIREDVFVVDLS
jgi:hypothetical protein